MDIVVETANGYCINFEFHRNNTTEKNILRNIHYAIDFRIEQDKLIKSYVISMADAEKSIKKAKISPDLEIEIPFIFFKNYNGDEILDNIKKKIKNNIPITEYDLFNLIFLPFMKHEKSDYEITKELIYLINEIDLSEEERYQIKACQTILVDIFIPKEEQKEMIKVVNMSSTFLENYEEELIEEGKEEGRKEFAKKLKNDNVPIEKIIQYTGLSLSVIKKL